MCPHNNSENGSLTHALEDYIETIYELTRDNDFARVKDISKARGVRSASVTPAMHRLSDLGLVDYVQREHVRLTPRGKREAGLVFAKHQLLTRFFRDVLGMSSEAGEADACEMKHSLSHEGMERLARFLDKTTVRRTSMGGK